MSVTKPQQEEYAQNGVVCIRSAISDSLVVRIRSEIDQHLIRESAMELGGEEIPLDNEIKPDSAHKSWQAFNGWKKYASYRELVFGSPLPAIAAELMNAVQVQLLYDHSFNKEPGSPVPVPWHHDLTFWPVSGSQICSVWVALDEVTTESGAVCFVRASHRWEQRFRPSLELNSETAKIANMLLEPCPNYFEVPGAELISWNMLPGDALVFSALTLHGSRGNNSKTKSRRAISPRFIGEDVRFVEGVHVLTPLLDPTPWLSAGAHLVGPDFPVAWTR